MNPTITIPKDFRTECQQTVAGHTFYFSRGFKGEGLWFTSEKVGNTPAHNAVPMSLQEEFSSMARKNGLSEQHNFSRMPPKPKSVPTSGGPRLRKKKEESPLMAGFNPFMK